MHAETQTRVNAVFKAHGLLESMLKAGWQSLLDQLQSKYGEEDMHECFVPAQSFYAAFEEQLADGCLEAQTLSHVVSVEEERGLDGIRRLCEKKSVDAFRSKARVPLFFQPGLLRRRDLDGVPITLSSYLRPHDRTSDFDGSVICG